MSPDDLRYYRERAEAERQRAAATANPKVAQLHLELASIYEKLLKLEQTPRPVLHVVEAMGPSLERQP